MVSARVRSIPNAEGVVAPKSEAGIHTFSLTTLGRFALSVDGISVPSPATRKARALMAFLIMNRGADAARERCWRSFGLMPIPNARDSLATALSQSGGACAQGGRRR